MDYPNPSYLSRLVSSPESLTDNDLLQIPLRNLTRNLKVDLSPSVTLSIYLRWLEVHRRAPSKLSLLWPNTVTHWVLSLRTRGILEPDIVTEVVKWTAQNGPFRAFAGRHPPRPHDIATAYRVNCSDNRRTSDLGVRDSPHALSSTEYKRQRSSNFDKRSLPENYLCNRCKNKGHHVKKCPTNLDPTYDNWPPLDYVCVVCGERGSHYKGLCPRNIDPNSLTQQRKAILQPTPVRTGSGTSKALDRVVDSQVETDGYIKWNENDGKLSKALKTPQRLTRDKESTQSKRHQAMQKLDVIKNLKTRLERGESLDLAEIEGVGIKNVKRFSNMDRKTSRQHQHLQSGKMSYDSNQTRNKSHQLDNKMPLIEKSASQTAPREESRRAQMESSGTSQEMQNLGHESFTSKANVENEVERFLDALSDEILGRYEAENRHDKVNALCSSKLGSQSPTADAMDLDQAGAPANKSGKSGKEYSEFVQKLMQTHSKEIVETVNPMRKRPTALDMWEQDDQRRAQQMVAKTPDRSAADNPTPPSARNVKKRAAKKRAAARKKAALTPDTSSGYTPSSPNDLSSPQLSNDAESSSQVNYTAMDRSCDDVLDDSVSMTPFLRQEDCVKPDYNRADSPRIRLPTSSEASFYDREVDEDSKRK